MIRRYPSIIIPVKPVAIGKSRLRASVGVADDLVIAIALDTVEAALSVASVLVVTDDPAVADAAAALGAEVTPDAPDAGLNAAIRHGDALLAPGSTRVALTADLPALRGGELAGALSAFAARSTAGRAYVADHVGTGTTMLIASPGVPLDPHFGPESATAHMASGALALDGYWPSLRLDVDTRTDLDAASTLGLGRRTTAVLARV